jgi:hypothetical protein
MVMVDASLSPASGAWQRAIYKRHCCEAWVVVCIHYLLYIIDFLLTRDPTLLHQMTTKYNTCTYINVFLSIADRMSLKSIQR